MNANVALAVSVSDDLVIEEFGGYLTMAQAPKSCIGTWVTPGPIALVDAA